MREAYEIVEHVQRIAEILVAERARIAKEGGDATPFAGAMADALRIAGARLLDGNANRLRWHVAETPSPKEDPTGYKGAAALAAFLADCLRRGAGEDRALELAAEVWPNHKSKAAADVEVQRIEQARADVQAAEARVAHERRLAATAKKIVQPAPVVVPEHPASILDDRRDGEFSLGTGDDGYREAGVG